MYQTGMLRKRVLIVEDSPTQAAQLRALLMANNLTVQTAADGLEGLRHAEDSLPDLVILDLELPGMSGIEVAKSLKANTRTRDIPIILFTRHDSPDVMAMGLEHGIVDFIPKDVFAKIVLLETLKHMGIITH
jgi:CheY-like chemotaxis protein